ncbi:MAG: hypothetical protein AAGA38_15230 [Pseudomonadota bacterium]
MTPTNSPLTYDEAIERGRQARALAMQDAVSAIRQFLAARLTKEVTA